METEPSGAARLTSLVFAVDAVLAETQSSSWTSSCREAATRLASLTRLAMISHWGVRPLDFPANESQHERFYRNGENDRLLVVQLHLFTKIKYFNNEKLAVKGEAEMINFSL